eukprot:2929079-Alexandrium_andersonii.AAC.1
MTTSHKLCADRVRRTLAIEPAPGFHSGDPQVQGGGGGCGSSGSSGPGPVQLVRENFAPSGHVCGPCSQWCGLQV